MTVNESTERMYALWRKMAIASRQPQKFPFIDETYEWTPEDTDKVNSMISRMKLAQAGIFMTTTYRCCPSANSCPFGCHADHENDE